MRDETEQRQTQTPRWAPAPAWGLGDGTSTGSAHERLPVRTGITGSAASWRAALAVVVNRYEGESAPDRVVIGVGRGAVELRLEGSLDDVRRSEVTPVDRLAPVGMVFDPAGVREAADTSDLPPFPLTISFLVQGGGGGELRCDYLPSHIESRVAAGFLRCLAHVHGQVLAAPETPVADVDLLDDVDYRQIAALGRSRRPAVGRLDSIPEAFRGVVAAEPDRVALRDGDVRLTYRELDDLSDRLAVSLRNHGVRDGEPVSVCLDRSAELVAILLGVLKAGAVYVPIDPVYPVERMAYIVADSRPNLVITRRADIPRGDGRALVTPDDLAQEGAEGALPAVSPEAAAYVIYTSGSTGRPKGVVVPHRNVLSLVSATRDDFGLGPSDAWPLFHSVSFDFSVWELWGCLLTGGCLVVVPHAVSREPERFRDLVVAHRITVLNQTPTALANLLTVDHAKIAARLLILGGEPLDAGMLLPWFDQHPEHECRVVNMYGITETTVHVTAQTVTRESAQKSSRAVGKTLPGWHVQVLDPRGRPALPGVSGEIYVSGEGLARGYLGRAAMTAERFVPDSFTGARMYRTGDRGRLLPDGVLEHLGRLDSQVKIRGFRVELDEIRLVLMEDPCVHAAVVVPHHSRFGAADRIEAYVVLAEGASGSGVRRRAASLLPEYMVPATVTAVDAFPLTANGKLDLSRLPAPVFSTEASSQRESTLDDDLAAHLKTLWSDTLGVSVGMDDDFFDAGGDSATAVQVCASMRAKGLADLRMRQLYRNSTIRAVVALVHTNARTASETEEAAR